MKYTHISLDLKSRALETLMFFTNEIFRLTLECVMAAVSNFKHR